jgi:site-specific DNA recombinase
MGGNVPLGYRVENRKLVVVEDEARLVQRIFERFATLGSAFEVAHELNRAGEVTKRRPHNGQLRGGKPWTKGAIYKVLANRVYRGEAVHKGVAYPGEHAPIVDGALWNRAHARMATPARSRAATTRTSVIFGPDGRPMSPTHTRRRGRTYRHYVARAAIEAGYDTAPVTTVPAGDVEAAVLAQPQHLLTTPEMIARAWATAKADSDVPLSEAEVTGLLADFGGLWPELFPAERARLLQLLVERVDVLEDGLELRLKAAGLASLVAELRPRQRKQAA